MKTPAEQIAETKARLNEASGTCLVTYVMSGNDGDPADGHAGSSTIHDHSAEDVMQCPLEGTPSVGDKLYVLWGDDGDNLKPIKASVTSIQKPADVEGDEDGNGMMRHYLTRAEWVG